MESFLNYLPFESKNKMVDLLAWQKQITNSYTYNSVDPTFNWTNNNTVGTIFFENH